MIKSQTARYIDTISRAVFVAALILLLDVVSAPMSLAYVFVAAQVAYEIYDEVKHRRALAKRRSCPATPAALVAQMAV